MKMPGLLRELVALFVDDGSLAVAVLAWVGISAGISAQIGLAATLKGTVLFGGCALILLENVSRRARKR